jgi:hypothetical protein
VRARSGAVLNGATRPPRRHAFSLVELVVAAACGLVLIAVASALMVRGRQLLSGVEGHLDTLHSAQILLERLEADLHRLMVRSPRDLSVFEGATLGTGKRDALAFLVAEPGPGGREPVYVGRRVEWRAVRHTDGRLRLARNGEVDQRLPLERLELAVGIVPSRRAGARRYFVKTTLVAVDQAASRSFTMTSLAAIAALDRWETVRSFNSNPDDSAPVLALEEP